MKIRIHVTKEILEKSKMCGTSGHGFSGYDCAIALAVKDVFPDAGVATRTIFPFCANYNGTHAGIDLPDCASRFIRKFDALTPQQRQALEPMSFEIDVPDSVIERIGITEVERILSESNTLERV